MEGVKEYQAGNCTELSINYGGNNYLVIYGNHVNGGFCSIPNWEVGCELSSYADDTFFNGERIGKALGNMDAGNYIAGIIAEHEKTKMAAVSPEDLVREKAEAVGRTLAELAVCKMNNALVYEMKLQMKAFESGVSNDVMNSLVCQLSDGISKDNGAELEMEH